MSLPYGAIKGRFETSGALRAPYLTGEISAYLTESGGAEPVTIIRADQDWQVHVNWTLSGKLTEFVCGEWCLNLFLESIGPGDELKLPDGYLHIPLDPKPGDNHYYETINIPAGRITAEMCSTPYKLVVTVTYLTPYKHQPGPMAGFVEGPVVQFYQP
jgi:hypothetical protein